MIKSPKLTPVQWKLLANAFSNIGQAIILFSLASLFAPEAINLPREFSRQIALGFLTCGFFTLGVGVIIARKEV